MKASRPSWAACLLLALMTLAASSCMITTLPSPQSSSRPFNFTRDALSYANELDWIYRPNPETGKMDFIHVDPEPEYIHRCFVLVKTAKQFFLHAQFDAQAPIADEKTYRALVRKVVSRSPRDLEPSSDPDRVVIPGYADLRSFSAAWASLLKDETGGSWHSYVQLGNWRMILPFPRSGQQKTVEQLLTALKADWPPIVHVVTFPVITINHALLIYAAHENDKTILFDVYDPNHPEAPGELTYDRASRTFIFPATNYFADGPVNVYEVYHGLYF